ncbi:hypothetical protein [Streptomyces montanus]|uniref:hypothetical protein n=1 Tax=Streptomyces montanus TaxID=2580423 RepID=UPI0014874945|nr:hypothetical protein [Streptomyces montanus]
MSEAGTRARLIAVELGGIRSVLDHMQRTAVQGPPATLSALTGPGPIATTDLQGEE